MGIYPGYDYPIALDRYAEIAKSLGLKGSNDEELMEAYIKKLYKLYEDMNVPKTFQAAGINEVSFLKQLHEIALQSFDDQCTPTNPRFPLVKELEEILKQAHYGEDYQEDSEHSHVLVE
jgi:acetaldehyde dehydrogenase/alcohol dehydrogenase